MIDTLYQNLNRLQRPSFWQDFGLADKPFFLLTLHRPSNVDDALKLKNILDSLLASTEGHQIIFPIHPRTKKIFSSIQIKDENLKIVDPLSYLEFIYLVKNSKGVITDSGGITEETTVLKVPCLTLRNSTERPETVTIGTNELIGEDISQLRKYLAKIIEGKWKEGAIPPLWDGKTAERIVSKLYELYKQNESIPVVNYS
jgi:UDP-N-acetylglucosamine 2-epimerase (non-hydrolysing)